MNVVQTLQASLAILEIQASGPDAAIWSAQRPMGCLFGLLHVALGDLRCQGVWGTGILYMSALRGS